MTALEILSEHRAEWLVGLGVTLKLCAWIWVTGLSCGTILGAAAVRWKLIVGIPSRIFSFLLGGMPVIVLLFWLHYPFQTYFELMIDPFVTAVFALSLVNTILVADLVRGVLTEFPHQYIAAAKVCGLTPQEIIWRIQLPIVLRQAIPGLLTLQIVMLQTTLFASLISVDEIFRIAQRINSQVYQPVEIYSALAVLFLAICLPINGIAAWLKQRFTRNFSEN